MAFENRIRNGEYHACTVNFGDKTAAPGSIDAVTALWALRRSPLAPSEISPWGSSALIHKSGVESPGYDTYRSD